MYCQIAKGELGRRCSGESTRQCDSADSALSCGLSLLLVLFSAPTGVSLDSLAFPSPQKPTLLNSKLIRNRGP